MIEGCQIISTQNFSPGLRLALGICSPAKVAVDTINPFFSFDQFQRLGC